MSKILTPEQQKQILGDHDYHVTPHYLPAPCHTLGMMYKAALEMLGTTPNEDKKPALQFNFNGCEIIVGQGMPFTTVGRQYLTLIHKQ